MVPLSISTPPAVTVKVVPSKVAPPGTPTLPISSSVQGLRIGLPTVKLTVPLWTSVPLVPVMVSAYLPGAAVPGVTTSEEMPVPVIEVGLKEDEAPVGSPLTLSEMTPLNPSAAVVVIA